MHPASRDGFSLLEALVSLAILSLIIALVATTLQGMLTIGGRQQTEPERLRQREEALTLPARADEASTPLEWVEPAP